MSNQGRWDHTKRENPLSAQIKSSKVTEKTPNNQPPKEEAKKGTLKPQTKEPEAPVSQDCKVNTQDKQTVKLWYVPSFAGYGTVAV